VTIHHTSLRGAKRRDNPPYVIASEPMGERGNLLPSLRGAKRRGNPVIINNYICFTHSFIYLTGLPRSPIGSLAMTYGGLSRRFARSQ
jgi:hypothetical protein